jgi:hypothetical protein
MKVTDIKKPYHGYCTSLGRYWNTTIEEWLSSDAADDVRGQVDLLLTSPPFPLNNKKAYGNRTGADYLKWLSGLAPNLGALLSKRGSLVLEIGNAWTPGQPTVSTLPMEALLAFKEAGDFHLCQEFICHNPARLPSPAQYVTVERCRVKDSWTRIWWLSKTVRPRASNRDVLIPYSAAMRALLKRKSYNSGRRPSEHRIGDASFFTDNGGAIPSSALTEDILEHFGSLLVAGNTASAGDLYLAWCKANGAKPHPARMQPQLARFFISFLTQRGHLVLDPFAGSNTTGAVAEELGRRWCAIEASKDYCEASKSRFVSNAASTTKRTQSGRGKAERRTTKSSKSARRSA